MNIKKKAIITVAAAITFSVAITSCDKSGGTATASSDGKSSEAGQASDPILRAENTAKISIVTPTAEELKALKPDYITYRRAGENGLSLTPVPPAFEKPVTVKVAPNANGYDVIASSEKCAAKLNVTIDGAAPQQMDPTAAAKIHLEGAVEQTVSVQIMDKATPNYYCSLLIIPTGESGELAPTSK